MFLLLIILSLKAEEITKIAMGSCNKENMTQPLWNVITQDSPQVWVWMGDNIYADTFNPIVMKKKYQLQLNRPDYKSFKEKVKVLGIWDDHDYGQNNSGKYYPMKEKSQDLFLDFIGVPKDHKRRNQKGIYHLEKMGVPGKMISFYLLDTRYFKALPGNFSSLLGDQQWKWLSRNLESDTSDLILIFSGIQIIPKDHPYEKWGQYPNEKKRLFSLLKKYPNKRIILFSGDRHFAEISAKKDLLPYPLYEITSSGLSHSYINFSGEKNTFRVGKTFTQLNYALLSINWEPKLEVKVEIKGLKGVGITQKIF